MSLWRLCAGVLLMCSVLSGSDAALDAATEGNWTFPCCHITGGNLTYIPRINITCDCLNFSNNTLRNITNETFKNITFVKSLILHKDKIRNISSYAFRNLTSLKYLDLQYNFIYPHDLVIAFQSLHHNIQIINLSRNRLKRFNGFVDVLIGKNITTLTLEYCRIEQTLNFSELSLLKPLRVLSMGHNALYTTTGHVPSHLTNITLRDNYLRHLPRFCSNHTKVSQLRYLDLCDNNIYCLPRLHIECLTSLEYLYITNNQVGVIGSSTFTSLPRLGVIYLENVFENANGHVYSYAFNNSVIKSLILNSLTAYGSFIGTVDPACLGGCGGLLELSLCYNDMADANNTFLIHFLEISVLFRP
ncbi:leucine-rich repeat-containing protein 15-like isoform X1 [Haliotis rufescens]|uniref:leucine-rich repeat-containing protein 15-like isoform X1 n=1 Tax=Haliotis rufescens TaxID=6454 RepID=UPI00201FAA15|nr:leucine-rich repeat-containing protein 15-like isoform X1 [Haliotis rufescens]